MDETGGFGTQLCHLCDSYPKRALRISDLTIIVLMAGGGLEFRHTPDIYSNDHKAGFDVIIYQSYIEEICI